VNLQSEFNAVDQAKGLLCTFWLHHHCVVCRKDTCCLSQVESKCQLLYLGL